MAKNGGTRMGGRNSRKAKRAAELPAETNTKNHADTGNIRKKRRRRKN